MFTGLIQQVCHLEEVSIQAQTGRLMVQANKIGPLDIGESIAINGVCLTLVEQKGQQLTFDILRETLERSSLGGKLSGARLNLERAMRMGDAIGGHLVSGHVDGVGTVLQVEMASRDQVLLIAAPELISEIIPKGSVAIDGISLTVVDVDSRAGTFTVHIIPHTWNETALSDLSAGKPVNLESDMIGKYVRSSLKADSDSTPTVTWDKLRNAGFGSLPSQ